MAYSKIIHTKSEAVGAIPSVSSLSFGEIAINYSDGDLYIKKADNTIRKVASTDHPAQISKLLTDVTSHTNRLDFITLQFREATDLNFGRGNTNPDPQQNASTFGLNNEIGSSGNSSSLFGEGNKANGAGSLSFGKNNICNGADAITIGLNITAPAGVAEFGHWSNSDTRLPSVRCGSNNVGISLSNSSTALVNGDSTAGAESADTLPYDMYAFRRNGDEILIDVNIDGTVTTGALFSSASTAVKNNQTDAVPLNTIRQLTEAQYDALAAASPSAVNPNTMYFIVGP